MQQRIRPTSARETIFTEEEERIIHEEKNQICHISMLISENIKKSTIFGNIIQTFSNMKSNVWKKEIVKNEKN